MRSSRYPDTKGLWHQPTCCEKEVSVLGRHSGVLRTAMEVPPPGQAHGS